MNNGLNSLITRCLSELQQTRPMFQIAGTRFAIYLNDNSGRDEQA
jgi:hypothetical protein